MAQASRAGLFYEMFFNVNERRKALHSAHAFWESFTPVASLPASSIAPASTPDTSHALHARTHGEHMHER